MLSKIFKWGTNKFKDYGLKDARFNKWLEKDINVTKAKCKLSCKRFDIGNMGVTALEIHYYNVKWDYQVL